MIDLSKRLRKVIELAATGRAVADVGCDHGYISIELVGEGCFEKAYAMDIRKGPLSIASSNIAKYELTDRIETILSDGIRKLPIGEADTMIVAGMGGALNIKILQQDMDKCRLMKRIVLQPQSEIHLVRKFLIENSFAIEEEAAVWDEGKFYQMFVTRYDANHTFSEDEQSEVALHYGSKLLDRRDKALHQYLCHEKNTIDEILDKLNKKLLACEANKKAGIEIRIKEIELEQVRNAKALSMYLGHFD